MKIARRVMFLICAFVLLISLAACGGVNNSTDSSGSTGSTGSTDLTGSTSQSESVQTIPPPDATLKDDSVIGDWTDISDNTRYAKIAKTDDGYQYQDPENTYTATFTDGILKVQVTDTETADVYFDAKSGNLLSIYEGDASFFKKSQ